MAEIKAILKVNDKGNGEIDSITSNLPQINISRNPNATSFNFYYYLGQTETPYKPTIAGQSTIGDGTRILDKYDGYLFRPNGNQPLILTIEGRNIINLSFYFDPTLENYPQTINIEDSDGTTRTLTNDSYMVSIEEMVAGYGTKTFTFSNWTNGNASINIKKILSFETSLTFDKSFIKEFSSQAQIMANPKSVFYGITSSTGSIELNDYDNSIYQKALMGYMDANAYTMYLYINNNLIQVHTGYDAPLYNADNTIDLSLTSKLNNIYNMVANSDIVFTQPARITDNFTSLYTVYSRIMYTFEFSRDEIENSMSTIINVGTSESRNDMSVSNYLMSIKLPLNEERKYVCMKKDESLANILSAICEVAQLELSLDEDGNLKFYNGRPLMTQEEYDNVLNITYDMQRTALTYDIMVANKYDSVEISKGGTTGSGGGSSESGGSSGSTDLSNLPTAATISSSDELVVLVGGIGKKISVANYENTTRDHQPIDSVELNEILV